MYEKGTKSRRVNVLYKILMTALCNVYIQIKIYKIKNINPNHPKPFKLQQQGLLDFDGLSTV